MGVGKGKKMKKLWYKNMWMEIWIIVLELLGWFKNICDLDSISINFRQLRFGVNQVIKEFL